MWRLWKAEYESSFVNMKVNKKGGGVFTSLINIETYERRFPPLKSDIHKILTRF